MVGFGRLVLLLLLPNVSEFHIWTLESMPAVMRYLPSDVNDGGSRTLEFRGPADW